MNSTNDSIHFAYISNISIIKKNSLLPQKLPQVLRKTTNECHILTPQLHYLVNPVVDVLNHTKILRLKMLQKLSNSLVHPRVTNLIDIFNWNYSFVLIISTTQTDKFVLIFRDINLFLVRLQSIFGVFDKIIAIFELALNGLPFSHLFLYLELFRSDQGRGLGDLSRIDLLVLISDICVEFACICSGPIVAVPNITENYYLIQLLFLV